MSRAEIQKEYRRRKKLKDGEAYMEKERLRVKQYYIPAEELSESQLKARRKEVLKRVNKSRANIKKAQPQSTRR